MNCRACNEPKEHRYHEWLGEQYGWRDHEFAGEYRDTRGMDRFYGGEEPPFAVNDDFARTGSISDY